jgi:hypothetical protein
VSPKEASPHMHDHTINVITITTHMTEDGKIHTCCNFGDATVIEIFGMLELARLNVIEQVLHPEEGDEE